MLSPAAALLAVPVQGVRKLAVTHADQSAPIFTNSRLLVPWNNLMSTAQNIWGK